MRKLVFGVGLLFVATFLFAQFPPTPPEIRRLNFMDGAWEGTLATGFGNMPATALGSLSNGGMYYRLDLTIDVLGDRIEETIFVGWNRADQQYEAHVFTSASTQVRRETGKLEDGVLIMESDAWDLLGQISPSRTTIQIDEEGGLSYLLEFVRGSGAEEVARGTLRKRE